MQIFLPHHEICSFCFWLYVHTITQCKNNNLLFVWSLPYKSVKDTKTKTTCAPSEKRYVMFLPKSTFRREFQNIMDNRPVTNSFFWPTCGSVVTSILFLHVTTFFFESKELTLKGWETERDNSKLHLLWLLFLDCYVNVTDKIVKNVMKVRELPPTHSVTNFLQHQFCTIKNMYLQFGA